MLVLFISSLINTNTILGKLSFCCWYKANEKTLFFLLKKKKQTRALRLILE